MKSRALRDRRLQPIVRSMRRSKTYEYAPSGRKVKFEREGDRLIRWLTCYHCEMWYRADRPFPPVHCGDPECSAAAARRKRRSLVAWA
jgi:hypothetical protein